MLSSSHSRVMGAQVYCGRQIEREEMYSDEVRGVAPYSRGPTEYTWVAVT